MSHPDRDNVRGLKRLLRPQEVAEIIGSSTRTVHRRIKSGEIPAVRIGRLVRIHPDDLVRYIELSRSR